MSDARPEMRAAPSPATPQKPWDLYTGRQRGTFLFVLFLVGTSNYVDRNIIGVLLEPIKNEFQVSDTMLGLLSGISFALFYATLGIPVARWADRGDRRFIITLALTIWSVMTALCGMAQNFWQLALARVGVGAGEAGAIPPAQSLIADYFPPDGRSKAIGIYMMCSMAGYVLGLVAGGWIAQNYGWRAAFLIVGLPGLLLAILTRFLIKEPRHLPQFAIRADSQESVMATFRALFEKPSYRNIIYAMVLYFLMAYGALVFTSSFMIRVHGLTIAEAGGLFGTMSAIGAVIGNLAGGIWTDRLAKRDIAWTARLPGWGLMIALPLYWGAFLAPSVPLMAGILLIASIVLTGVIPPMFSALHLVCGTSRRAMAVAIAFFFANLIGLGLGPIIAGSLSDWFAQSHGPGDGLRYALMIVMVVFVPSGFFMLRAARTLRADMED
ncbi:spinster family MFS transporter [Sphingosinicella rhizophila]|uniref:MFS transporter n=1 Tax=Sphingosinicella rhizophila TaxID=3050082 RepID=A0ABU3Q9Q3_9SPHN|nr:MFS transporter [Sphingosinicella sp. GR2756]MDT9600112.1 MFS transporter [Sphingosinicella sp. GR2756]